MPETLGYQFPFVVNIPAGSAVLVATVRQTQGEDVDAATFVHDQSGKIVYCGPTLRDALMGHTTSTVDPLAVLARAGWSVVETVQGTLVGAIVSSSVNTYDHRGRSNSFVTQIFVEVGTTGPYR